LPQIDGWQVLDSRRLTRTYTSPDFKQAIALVDRVGALAEQQNHHAEIKLSWGKVRVDIWTHKVNGLPTATSCSPPSATRSHAGEARSWHFSSARFVLSR